MIYEIDAKYGGFKSRNFDLIFSKEGNNEKDAEKDTEKDKEKDNDEDNDGEWVLCGMTLSDGSEDLSLGRFT